MGATFIRAKDDDTQAMAFGALWLGRFGDLNCAACGDPKPFRACIVMPDDGWMYAYAVCALCHAAMSDEGAITEHAGRGGKPLGPLFATRIEPKGRVTASISAALEAFISAQTDP